MRLVGLWSVGAILAALVSAQGCSRTNPAFADSDEGPYTSGDSGRPTTGSLVTSASDSMVSDSDSTKPGSESDTRGDTSSGEGTSTFGSYGTQGSGGVATTTSGGSDSCVGVCPGTSPPPFEVLVQGAGGGGQPFEDCDLAVTGQIFWQEGALLLNSCEQCPCIQEPSPLVVVSFLDAPNWLPLELPDCGEFRLWAPPPMALGDGCDWQVAMYTAADMSSWGIFTTTEYPLWVPFASELLPNGCEAQCDGGPGGHTLAIDGVDVPEGEAVIVGEGLVTNFGAFVDDTCENLDVLWTVVPDPDPSP